MIPRAFQKEIGAIGVDLRVSGNKVAQSDCLIEKNPVAVVAQLDNVPSLNRTQHQRPEIRKAIHAYFPQLGTVPSGVEVGGGLNRERWSRGRESLSYWNSAYAFAVIAVPVGPTVTEGIV